MKTMPQIALAAAAAVLCLATAGCDSKGTSEVKQEAKAIDESYKAQADLVEATGKNAPGNAAAVADRQADALRNQGDAIKDHLINEAEQTQHDTRKH